MSRKATEWAWSLDIRPATLKLILLGMADRADEVHCCFPSIKRLVADTCLNEKTVQEGINKLLEQGFIHDTGERKGPTQRVRVFKLNIAGESPQKRNDTKNGVIQKNVHGNDPEIGVFNDPEIGVFNDPEIGVLNQSLNQSLNLNHSQSPLQDSPQEPADKSAVVDLFADGEAAQVGQPEPPTKPKNRYPDWFEKLWQKFPPRTGATDKRLALHAANARLAEGKTPDDLLAAVDRYAKFVKAIGRWGSQYVMQAKTFFGPGGHIENPWSVKHEIHIPNYQPRESSSQRVQRQVAQVFAQCEAGEAGGGDVAADGADIRGEVERETG